MSLLTGLNDKQKEAVQTTKGPLLVRAGAGSGKTRVLTRRIVYLIKHDHIRPMNILALTFTNKAAKEMAQRINKLLGSSNNSVWASTFHSLGIRILKMHNFAQFVDYKPSFTIAGPSTPKTIIKNIIGKDLDKDTKQNDPREFQSRISSCKNKLLTPADVQERFDADTKNGVPVSPKDKLFVKVYTLYQSHLRQTQTMDFDDLIMYPVLIFQQHPSVLHYFQDWFKYISVDEYQDTNHAQYEMVNLLASKYHNICAVGDENQSIYGWRGADISNIRDFTKDYPQAKVIFMEQNYRSTKNILGAADSVIKHNYKHLPKTQRPWTADKSGRPVVIYRGQDAKSEAHFVVDEIGKQIAFNHYTYKDFAVLYRANALSRNIEDALIKSGMPYQIIGGNKFLDRKEIQDVLAYLTILLNAENSVCFERVVNTPHRGIGNGTLNKLRDFADKHHWNLLHAVFQLNKVPNALGPSPKRKLLAFGRMINHLRYLSHRISVTALTLKVLRESHYIKHLKDITFNEPDSQKSKRAENRLQNLSEFISQTKEFDEANHSVPVSTRLSAFLDFIELKSSQDKIKNHNCITLMTIHAAKGLEYPIVFMIGMNNGIFPSYQSVMGDNTTAINAKNVKPEERRVCYVGMTRAERQLYLTNAYVRQVYGQTEYWEPSEFLKEIDPKYIRIATPNRDDLGNDIM